MNLGARRPKKTDDVHCIFKGLIADFSGHGKGYAHLRLSSHFYETLHGPEVLNSYAP